jgi:hypothetical protein
MWQDGLPLESGARLEAPDSCSFFFVFKFQKPPVPISDSNTVAALGPGFQ